MALAQAKKIKQLLPLIDAIKARCLDCSAGSQYEVKMCVCTNCALFSYREGLNFQNKKSSCKNSKLDEKTALEGESAEEKNEVI